jgi:hypothetical protein
MTLIKSMLGAHAGKSAAVAHHGPPVEIVNLHGIAVAVLTNQNPPAAEVIGERAKALVAEKAKKEK